MCWSMPKTFTAIVRTVTFEKLCDGTCGQWCTPSKVSWIGIIMIIVCGRTCEQWCKVTWIVFWNRKEGMPSPDAILSYFQTDYTIVWLYHDVWYKHVFAEFWYGLSYICTLRALFMLKKVCPVGFLAVFDSKIDVCWNLKKVVNSLLH